MTATTMPSVKRCTCGHVYDWHYTVGAKGNPSFGGHGKRCPAFGCACAGAKHDGNAAQTLPVVATFPAL